VYENVVEYERYFYFLSLALKLALVQVHILALATGMHQTATVNFHCNVSDVRAACPAD
jgi:hypothetical protein